MKHMATTPFADAAATWNKRFESDALIFGAEPNEYLRSKASLLAPAGRVLCVADGEGRNSVWLARQGQRVDAFDIAANGVAKARKLAADAGVTVNYSVAECDAWAWPADAWPSWARMADRKA